jgi:UDP-2,4-diacetamido-2,4,6-trideoxy-beta-L-altropyranose hydrolase
MSSPLAAFRVDASSAIGGGHVVRCLALADALKAENWRVIFHCGPESTAVVPALARSPHTVGRSDSVPAEATALAVFDGYHLSRPDEATWRAHARCMLVIDDLADRPHECDVLVDPTHGRDPADYRNRVPAAARVLTGASYAMLRPQFRLARRAALARRHGGSVERVLVSFGANDGKGMVPHALRALAAVLPHVDVDVVLGARPPTDELVALAATLPLRVSLLGPVDDMAALMVDADLCIGGAGGTAWERCCLGLPTVAVQTADNQAGVMAGLAAAGAAAEAGDWTQAPARLADAALALALDGGRRREMAHRAAILCDGLGTRRIVLAVSPETAGDGGPVTLRPASVADGEIMLAWQSNPETRRHFRHPVPPARDEHFAWLAGKLADPFCLLNVIEHRGLAAGVLRLDHIEAGWEVSILAAPDKRGLGIGPAALKAARRLLAGETLIAEVHPANLASHRAFQAAGFRQEGGVYACRTAAQP